MNKKFTDLTTTKKGYKGEAVEALKKYFKEKGCNFYPCGSEDRHICDGFITRVKTGFITEEVITKLKKLVFLEDMKTKPKRIYYNDTGFNLINYAEYKAICKLHNTEIFISFVDERSMSVYGNWLRKLEEEWVEKYDNGKTIHYSNGYIENGIIYFPLHNMDTIGKLTPKETTDIRNLNTSNNYPVYR